MLRLLEELGLDQDATVEVVNGRLVPAALNEFLEHARPIAYRISRIHEIDPAGLTLVTIGSLLSGITSYLIPRVLKVAYEERRPILNDEQYSRVRLSLLPTGPDAGVQLLAGRFDLVLDTELSGIESLPSEVITAPIADVKPLGIVWHESNLEITSLVLKASEGDVESWRQLGRFDLYLFSNEDWSTTLNPILPSAKENGSRRMARRIQMFSNNQLWAAARLGYGLAAACVRGQPVADGTKLWKDGCLYGHSFGDFPFGTEDWAAVRQSQMSRKLNLYHRPWESYGAEDDLRRKIVTRLVDVIKDCVKKNLERGFDEDYVHDYQS